MKTSLEKKPVVSGKLALKSAAPETDDTASAQRRVDTDPPPPLGREKIGRYEIIYPIAHGGMASVYAGRLSSLAGFEKLVAIKVIHPHLASDPQFVAMFLDEAKIAGQIQHPNVGEIYEVGEDDNILFMVQELVTGQSLRSFLRRAKALGAGVSHPIAADIMAKVCLGLHAAHELRGPDGTLLDLVHRDVSPQNILISYDGFVKLIDFGVAWAQTRSNHTAEGIVKGKIGYMSPEQLRGRRLDRRSDVFSLGVVLYLAVTGTLPFKGRSDLDRITKLLRGEFYRPSEINPNVAPELEQIILTAMAFSPDSRFTTASEMAQELTEFARKSDEEVGSDTLFRLMHWLFAEEHQTHEEQLRKGRSASQKNIPERISDASHLLGASLDLDKLTQPATPASLIGKDELIEGEIAVRRIIRSPLRRVYIVGMLVTMLIAVALYSVFFSGFWEQKAPVVPTANPAPIPAAPVTSPPAKPEATVLEEKGSPQESKTTESSEKPPPAEAETSRITVNFLPLFASVKIDGKPLPKGTRNVTVTRDHQTHIFEISAHGYETESAAIIADSDKSITIRLKPLSQPPVSTGRVNPDKRESKRKSSTPSSTSEQLKLKSNPYD